MSLAQEFMDRFAGNNLSYGTYRVDTIEESGKNVGKAMTVKGAVDVTLWQHHLEGTQSLGIVPIMYDMVTIGNQEFNGCRFGAIDIDAYKDFDPADMARQIGKLGLPLVVCRSKSGGAHLYLFASELVPAGLMIDRMQTFLHILGLRKQTEVFPKQRAMTASGSWINMPYFDVDKTSRFAYSIEGIRLLAEQFLAYAREQAQSLLWFQTKAKDLALPPALEPLVKRQDQYIPNGPPCLQRLAAEGIPEGARNKTMLNVGVYLKRAIGNSNWNDACFARLSELNQSICEPPLDESELRGTIVKSMRSAKIRYQCKDEPLQSYCNAPACRGREFGVGRDGKRGEGSPSVRSWVSAEGEETADDTWPEDFPIIGQLSRFMTEPPTWALDINERSVPIETDHIQNPVLFMKILIAYAKYIGPMPTAESWRKFTTDLLNKSIDVEVDEPDQFWQELEYFCRKYSPNTPAREDVMLNNVWIERGYMWFQLRFLMLHLRTNRLGDVSEERIKRTFKMRGFPQETWDIHGAEVYVWGVPEYTKMTPKELKAEERPVL